MKWERGEMQRDKNGIEQGESLDRGSTLLSESSGALLRTHNSKMVAWEGKDGSGQSDSICLAT